MECLMKGCFKPEVMVVKQVVFEDISKFNHSKSNASVSGDDLFVDQLLNLNNDAEEDKDDNGILLAVNGGPFYDEETQPSNANKDSAFLSPLPQMLETNSNRDDFGSVLSIPAEEADLQWLSQFVEESFSSFSTPYPTGFGPFSEKLKPKSKTEPESEPGFEDRKARIFIPSTAQSKARRSKRTRTGCRVWSTGTALAETSSSSSSSNTTTTSSFPSSPNLYSPAKKQRKREPGSGGPGRRCSHCGVQKTPQWRAGPMGAKTLCNACGVRFKSGRLLPEYRPACSPTYSSKLHSNSHRKVLEMRRNKEMEMMIAAQPEPGLPNPVPSFG